MGRVMDWMDSHPNPTRSITWLSVTRLTDPFNRIFTQFFGSGESGVRQVRVKLSGPNGGQWPKQLSSQDPNQKLIAKSRYKLCQKVDFQIKLYQMKA